METKPQYVIIFFKGSYKIAEIEKIIRLQSDNGYTDIFADKEKCLTSCNSLTDCEKRLHGNSFCRIHQSHLVNLIRVDKIKTGKTWFVIMDDKSKVPVSRRQRQRFLSHFIVL